jgi:hypothetical protein
MRVSLPTALTLKEPNPTTLYQLFQLVRTPKPLTTSVDDDDRFPGRLEPCGDPLHDVVQEFLVVPLDVGRVLDRRRSAGWSGVRRWLGGGGEGCEEKCFEERGFGLWGGGGLPMAFSKLRRRL